MSGAVPSPGAHPLGRAAGVPRPVCPSCGRCVRGDPAPAPQRAPSRAGVARCGGARGASPGKAPFAVVKGVWPGSPPPPTARPLGGLSGFRRPHVVGADVRVWGPSTVPLACMPCGGCVPRRWWGAAPGGGGLPPLGGASGVRRCPLPGRPSSRAGSRGSAARVSRVRSVRAWGPGAGPTACTLAGRRCSLWGWPGGVPGEGAFRRCEGRLTRLSPSLDCPPSGRGVGVRRPHVVGAGVRVWGSITVPLACMPCGGCVPRGWWGAVSGGGSLPPF